MSDFDREAERERLREKYEQDREKRASTQRMSELLLRGATMTDSHCETCGDPIFRYEGEEFCATCEAEGDAGGEQTGEDGQSAESRGATEQTRTPRDQADDGRTTAAQTQPTVDERTRDALANGVEAPTAARGGDEEPSAPSRDDEASDRSDPPRRETAEDAPADLSEARAALVRTATRFARRAEAADHPSEAVDHLAAAREAAEALAALDRR